MHIRTYLHRSISQHKYMCIFSTDAYIIFCWCAHKVERWTRTSNSYSNYSLAKDREYLTVENDTHDTPGHVKLSAKGCAQSFSSFSPAAVCARMRPNRVMAMKNPLDYQVLSGKKNRKTLSLLFYIYTTWNSIYFGCKAILQIAFQKFKGQVRKKNNFLR